MQSLSLEDFMKSLTPDLRGSPARGSSNYRLAHSPSRAHAKAKNTVLVATGSGQSMFKIISTVGGRAGAKKLADYLGRQGEVELENREGRSEIDREKVHEMLSDWYPDFGTRRNSKDVMHVMVSTPIGTDPSCALEAARQFAYDHYENHDYLLALHTDTRHPHVHFMVQIKGFDGSRLTYNREDLAEARDCFADHCREAGVQVAASSRLDRGIGLSSRRTAEYQQNKRGELSYRDDEIKAQQTPELSDEAFLALKEQIYAGLGASAKSDTHPRFQLSRNQIVQDLKEMMAQVDPSLRPTLQRYADFLSTQRSPDLEQRLESLVSREIDPSERMR